ncbi:MAG: phosphoribosylformimino-5-aminoimidazole carboxamide ribotide isomerase [Ulvibacter sp.]|jgi:phosphoribosylformimino-5-aminoimidazole carboxamide ribotide isomerase
MNIYPAIDLKEGKCVRLYQGDMKKATIFNDSPLAQARFFEESGFKFLHIVDLDGAIVGASINGQIVQEIVNNVTIPVQIGGGIRNLEQIEKWLSIGVRRVIIGTAALTNPDLVIEAAERFPGQIIVGIDAKQGFVAIDGWVKKSDVKIIDLAQKFSKSKIAAIIYTDIMRDGTMQGVNIEATKILAENSNIPIIASGGVNSISNVDKISTIKQFGVEGVIIGRAIYEDKNGEFLSQLKRYL